MHLLQIYKLFPFREDLEEFMSQSFWTDWPKSHSLQPEADNPLKGTVLDEVEVDPQQWLLAIHLTVSWPDRCSTDFIARELEIDAPTALIVQDKVNRALALQPEFYTQLAKTLGSCARCG